MVDMTLDVCAWQLLPEEEAKRGSLDDWLAEIIDNYRYLSFPKHNYRALSAIIGLSIP